MPLFAISFDRASQRMIDKHLITRLLILQTKVSRGELVKIRGEQDHSRRRDRELALLRSRRRADDTHNITSAKMPVVRDERVRTIRIPELRDE